MIELIMRQFSCADAFAVETNILPGNLCVMGLLVLIVKILAYGLGIVAVIGIVIAGIQYLTARDSETQVANAKKRIVNVAIGLVAWAMMWGVLNWLIPGGMNLDMSQSYDQICATESATGGSTGGGHTGGPDGSSGGSQESGGSSQGGGNQENGGGQSGSSHTVNGVTKVNYEGTTYAFPLQGATKRNVLAINDVNGTSQPDNNWAHWPETGYMLDLMLYNGPQDPVADVPVVAITSGKLVWKSTNGYPDHCISLRISDDKGGAVEYIHMKGEPELQNVGRIVNAGDVIGHVGDRYCTILNGQGSGTAPHLHLQFVNDRYYGNGNHEFRSDLTKLQKVMKALWEVLPE